MSPVTILFLAANPPSSNRLSLDEEVRGIEERIGRRSPVELILRTHWATRPLDVQQVLNACRPTVLHFSGHGTAAGLMFHDANGQVATIGGSALSLVLAPFREHLRMVVLNACFSSEQAEEIAQEIDYVVGMSRAIPDRAARAFAASFYQALAYDHDVRNAFEQGLGGMRLDGHGRDLDVPRLIIRPGAPPLLGGSSPPFPVDDEQTDSGHPYRLAVRLRGALGDRSGPFRTRLSRLLDLYPREMTLVSEAVADGSTHLMITTSSRGRECLDGLVHSLPRSDLAGLEIVSVDEPPNRRRNARLRPGTIDDDTSTMTSPTLVDVPRGPILIKAPRLVVAFECGRPLASGLRLSLAEVDEVSIGRGPGRHWCRLNRQLSLSLRDGEVSRIHAWLKREADGWYLHDTGSKNGTQVDGEPVAGSVLLEDGTLVGLGQTLLVYRDRAEHAEDPKDRDLDAESGAEVFRTLSPTLEELWEELAQIAMGDVPVVITGPTGTGKDLVARAIHDLSGRRGAFVPVNCGALSRDFLESELFGTAGSLAHPGSPEGIGLVRKADGGTLFLDEIAALPLESQAVLLRFLQDGEVRPVGSADVGHVDVRVVAATHEDLAERVAVGSFPRNLYARLAGYEIRMPPLVERVEDVGSIIGVLLRRVGGDVRPSISLRAALALFDHSYPSNVRELEQALGAAVSLAGGGIIKLEHLPREFRALAGASPASLDKEVAAFRTRLLAALRCAHGDVTAAARGLGATPGHIRRWCRRLGIDLARPCR